MWEVMKFKDAIQAALAECGCRLQSISEAQTGAGWQRCRLDYQRHNGRRARVFFYLLDGSSETTVRQDVIQAVLYQEQLLTQTMGGMAESA
jgi:hypothetical protein